MLRVHNDITAALDERKHVILVMLDLSAAFDTLNYSILLQRLRDISSMSVEGQPAVTGALNVPSRRVLRTALPRTTGLCFRPCVIHSLYHFHRGHYLQT